MLNGIYQLLESKPHNPHYLNRYITFIEQCQQKNVGYEGYTEKHHIYPKADDMFPEYKDFRLHPWNCAVLTARQHFIAHLLLWKTFPNTVSCVDAIWSMSCRGDIFVNSRLYESMRIEAMIVISSRSKGTVPVKYSNNPDKSYFRISKNDPRYLSGELVAISKGSVLVKDKTGNTFRTPKDDPRYLSGELKHVTKGRVVVKDEEGNYSLVLKNDPRYLSGELVGTTKGMVTVKDKEGNIFNVLKNDPRYISGELVGTTKGTITVKDKEGNVFNVSKDDPRYISGELVSNLRGLKWYNNGIKNGRFLPGDEPEGYNTGRLRHKKMTHHKFIKSGPPL